jgi:hypothetical protein
MKLPLLACFSAYFMFFPPIDAILKKLLIQINEHRAQFPQEKVYIHTDKAAYLENQTLWFKGYLVDAIEHKGDTLSKVLYVDLVRCSDSAIVSQQMLYVKDNQCNGSIEIAPSFKNGDYILRGYTNWMRNFPNAYFFKTPIKILGNTPISEISKEINKPIQVLFFPEGGSFLNEIENNMGIKTINKDTKSPVSIEGVISDEQSGMPITDFKTGQDGITSVKIKPLKGHIYKANIRLSDGSITTQNLPNADLTGYAMQTDNLSSQVMIKTRISLMMPNEQKPSKLFIIAHVRGKPNFATTINIADKTESEVVVNIPKNKFEQEGIATITLFNENGLPIIERLVYVDDVSNKINFTVSALGLNKAREKIVLNIEAKDAKNEPVMGAFSISALSMIGVATYWQQSDMHSYMMLNSDLNTSFEDMSYYFSENGKDAAKHRDDLLLTQGWSRFEWKKVNQIPKFDYETEQSLTLQGTIKDKKAKLVANESIMLSIKDGLGTAQSGYLTTDDEGRFMVQNLHLMDTSSVIVYFPKIECKKCLLKLDTMQPPAWTGSMPLLPNNALAYIEKSYKDELLAKEKQKEIELGEVNVKAKRINKEKSLMEGRRMYKEAELVYNIKPEDLQTKKNAFEYLQGRGAVNILNYNPISPNSARVQSTRGSTSFEGNNEPLFLIDGTPTDLSNVMSLSITIVETIEVIKSARAGILFGARGANGVVNFLTRYDKKNTSAIVENGDDFAKKLVATTRGYSLVKTFYNPDYEKENDKAKADYRSTLLWAPNIETDKEGKATVTFYNNDLNSPILIKINGADFKGNLGGYTKLLKF